MTYGRPEPPQPPAYSPAMQRFFSSLRMDFETWHDGVPIDLEAIDQFTPAERRHAFLLLTTREITWRELQAFARLDLPEAWEIVDQAANDHLSVERRVQGAQLQAEAGRRDDLAEVVVNELKRLHRSADGETFLLLLTNEVDSLEVRRALLWASWNRTECAPNCAAQLLYLCKVAEDPLAMEFRDVILGIGPHNSFYDREIAFKKLQELVGLQLDE